MALNNLRGLICHKIQPTNGPFSFGQGKGKTLNSKPEEGFLGEPLAHWGTILLLSPYTKSMAALTQVLTNINKLPL